MPRLPRHLTFIVFLVCLVIGLLLFMYVQTARGDGPFIQPDCTWYEYDEGDWVCTDLGPPPEAYPGPPAGFEPAEPVNEPAPPAILAACWWYFCP